VTHFLLRLVSDYRYVIVFFGVGIESMGVPVPGETALVIGAVSQGQGHLAAWGVALAGRGGAVVGDNAGYWIGRRWGKRLLRVRLIRRLYDPRRVAIAERFFERRGWLAVFFGRISAMYWRGSPISLAAIAR
jgi:membrane protein DedA with SNARE-associated domain